MIKYIKLKQIYVLIVCMVVVLPNLFSQEIVKTKKYSWVGDTIYQDDFRAWAENDFQIKSNYQGQPGYYMPAEKEWKVKNNLDNLPHLSSSNKLYNAIYNMGLDELVTSIQPDTTFKAGRAWRGVWTRDVSYSVILSLAHLEPTATKVSLMKKICPTGRIIQDNGSGGSWPISSDRMIWVLAAYEYYKVTGDREWIKFIYPIIAKSIDDDIKTLKTECGLVRGETSFIDWRNQSYPQWIETVDIYKSESLSTSVIYFQALNIQAEIAHELGKIKDEKMYRRYAENIKEAINKYLWIEDKGYYAMYRYGRNSMINNPKVETLGESLAILFDVASPNQAKRITESNPTTPFGVGVFFPQIKYIKPYHNNALWPFVASYWAWANAKVGNEGGTLQAIGSVFRPAALFATNKENFCLDNGDVATELNSSEQLWSIAGNLAITHRILFGINFEVDGIRFAPFVPKALSDIRTLRNFRYRNSVLNITVEGYGNKIKSFTINGKDSEPFIPGNMNGEIDIYITMENNKIPPFRVKMAKNTEAPHTPDARLALIDGSFFMEWNPIEKMDEYKIIRNGSLVYKTENLEYKLSEPGEYQVIAVDKRGNESFASEPIMFMENKVWNIDGENLEIKSTEIGNYTSSDTIKGYSGKGFVETDHIKKKFSVEFSVEKDGEYLLGVRYANGNGPINTKNSAAIRTLFVDGKRADVIVMPHRGIGKWSEWGMSNYISVVLTKGKHKATIDFLPENENMNIKTNYALIDALVVYKKY